VKQEIGGKGIVGVQPAESIAAFFEENLSTTDVFVYSGHNGGEQYIRRTFSPLAHISEQIACSQSRGRYTISSSMCNDTLDGMFVSAS